MATFSELMTIMREDYLSDTFDGIESASPSEIDENVLWKNSQLLRFLKEAQEEAALRGHMIYDDDLVVDLVQDEYKYIIDPQAIQIDRITYGDKVLTHISKVDLERMFPDWRTQSGMAGKALYYWMEGYQLNVFPRPDATDVATDAELHLECYRMPDPLAIESDELEIPQAFHKNVIWYALHMAYGMADADAQNYKESQMYLIKFDQAFGPKLDNRVIIHQLEQPSDGGYLGPENYLSPSASSSDGWYS